jgi:hypothetical protein
MGQKEASSIWVWAKMNARWKPAGGKPEFSSPLHTRQGMMDVILI